MMNFLRKSVFILSLLAAPWCLAAQNVVVSDNPAANADASAMLDVQSSNKGMLVPRMTSAQRTAISNAAAGLLVFDTNTESFWFKAGNGWTELVANGGQISLSTIQDADKNTKVQVEKNANEDVIRFDLAGSEKWKMSGDALEPAAASVLIGKGVGTSGTGNIFIGSNAGEGVSGNNKLAIGSLVSGDMTAGTLTINNAYTLPAADGNSGQVLQTNGAGQVSWAVAGGSSLPPGTILAYGGSSLPAGFLACDGQSVSRDDYPDLFNAVGTSWGGNGAPGFNLPDLRGQFLRGWDKGAGVDPDTSSTVRTAKYSGGQTGNNVGSYQGDIFSSHYHGGGNHRHGQPFNGFFYYRASGGNWDVSSANGEVDEANETAYSGDIINYEGGAETRPKNVYVYYIIKY